MIPALTSSRKPSYRVYQYIDSRPGNSYMHHRYNMLSNLSLVPFSTVPSASHLTLTDSHPYYDQISTLNISETTTPNSTKIERLTKWPISHLKTGSYVMSSKFWNKRLDLQFISKFKKSSLEK